MKIHPLRHGVSFHLSLSLSVPLKGEKIAKEGVDKLAPSARSSGYFVTQETCDTISYVPISLFQNDVTTYGSGFGDSNIFEYCFQWSAIINILFCDSEMRYHTSLA